MTKRKNIIPTGFAEVDELLDGGPRRGEIVIIDGPRGSGKTTLLLRVLGERVRLGGRGLFASGEMAHEDMVHYASRIGVKGVDVYADPNGIKVDEIVRQVREIHADVVVVDSVQVMIATAGDEGLLCKRRGVERALDALKAFAESSGAAVFAVTHLTKQGTFATAPQKIEEVADAILSFDSVFDEDGRDTRDRVLRLLGGRRFERRLVMTNDGVLSVAE